MSRFFFFFVVDVANLVFFGRIDIKLLICRLFFEADKSYIKKKHSPMTDEKLSPLSTILSVIDLL